MKNKQRKQCTADRISGLPDEILLCILRRIKSPRQAAQTSLLSRRWWILWRSYPKVEFDHEDHSHSRCRKNWKKNGTGGPITMAMVAFQKFADSSIQRYSLDPLLRMEFLNLSLLVKKDTVHSPAVVQLLDLASKRKAEEVTIIVKGGLCNLSQPHIHLPFRLLSNPTAKLLKLEGIAFYKHTGGEGEGDLLSLNNLQSLHFQDVEFDDRLFANLIAGCPLLVTMRISSVMKLRKLRVCNLTNLKTLQISLAPNLEEVEIEAFRLETLHLHHMEKLCKFEITAPRLTVLEISKTKLVHLDTVISKLPSLISLTLTDISGVVMKKLHFSTPKLREFKLMVPETVEEMELDVGPGLAKFNISNRWSWPERLKRFVISQAPASYRREVDFTTDVTCPSFAGPKWFLQLNCLLSMLPQSQTVNIDGSIIKVTFEEEQVDHTIRPIDINRLQFETRGDLGIASQVALLDGLFWACRPRFLTLTWRSYNSERLLQGFLSLMSKYSSKSFDLNKRSNWQDQIEDVTTISATKDKVDFILTWQ